MKLTDLFAIVKFLEMPEGCLRFLQVDYPNAIAGLPGFKKSVKRQYRRLALQYHPDKNNGCDKRMKEINAVVDLLLQLRIEPPRPQPIRIVFQSSGGGGTSATSTSTTVSF